MYPIIDMHTHVWLAHAARDRSELIDAVQNVPLRRVYASGLAGECPDPETVRKVNNEVYRLMCDCDAARGQVYLNPRHGAAALDELGRCLQLGFTGIKLWIATLADDPLNFPVYEAAIDNGLPILLHAFDKAPGHDSAMRQQANESRARHVAAAAGRFPECTFIMAHIAARFVAGVECARGLPNLYVDLSGSYGELGMLEYAVGRLGFERILFGTDMPGSDLYHNLGKVLGASLTEMEKEAVLWRNTERIMR